ncbi:NAC domain-containing protein 83 [Sesamum angolense]|uniref:NAC domain-containing protein 83 n=1 Tax=Sesamum angolense TaxID=2727404 RepID=A0AAE1WLM1_9LAMI|nr:NAC domain-containing protein 83 [Sesamum angolense]
MDKFNFVRDGESKLPPGFRFQPTDEEIVFQYLARKTFRIRCLLQSSPKSTFSAFIRGSCQRPYIGNSDQDRYFFSNLHESNYQSVNRSSRTACGGYWKITGSDKQIVCSKRMPIVGIKRTLVFYKGKHPRAVRTDWFMHLYCIALSGNVAHNIQQKRSSQKRGTKAEVDGNSRRRNYDFMITGETSDTDSSSASSSSSCDSDSSVVSEVSSDSANSETNRGP